MHLLVQTSNRPICSHFLSNRFKGCQMWASVSQRKKWCQLVIIHSCSWILCSEAATHTQLESLPTKEQQQIGEIHIVSHLGLWAWSLNKIPVLCDLLLGCQAEVNFSFVGKQTKKSPDFNGLAVKKVSMCAVFCLLFAFVFCSQGVN